MKCMFCGKKNKVLSNSFSSKYDIEYCNSKKCKDKASKLKISKLKDGVK